MNNLKFNVPLISGKNNPTIIDISKLSTKKYRMQNKLFLCDGIKLFLEAVEFGADIKYIVIDNSADLPEKVAESVSKCANFGAKILCVESYIFEKISSENAPQGIITVCAFYEKRHTFSAIVENDEIKGKKTIILESVRDPGNIGTIFRNAVALGTDDVIISSDCADIYSQKVVRASMGALFKLNIHIVDDLIETVEKIKREGRRVLATALNDNALVLGKDKVTADDIIVLGNEGHGMSEKLIDVCTDTLFIPMNKNTESLNVATASAIIMWEISK